MLLCNYVSHGIMLILVILHSLDHVHKEPESEIQEENEFKRSMVVHKCHVAWVLTLFVSKLRPGASHHSP
jgi:hypothetical protein